MPEPAYWAIIFRAHARDAERAKDPTEAQRKWQKVSDLVGERNTKIPFLTMGELCLEAGNKILAVQAIRREKKYETKISALIEIGGWQEAVEDTFS